MTSRWILLVVLGLLGLSGCGQGGTGAAGPASADDNIAFTGLADLGDFLDLDDTLRVRLVVDSVGGDEDGPRIITTMRVENTGKERRALPELRMACEGSATTAYMVHDSSEMPLDVAAGATVDVEVLLYIASTLDYYDPIPPCEGTAAISLTVTSGSPDFTITTADGWRLDPDTLAALNGALPFTRSGGGDKDPDRAYAWVHQDRLSSGYQVVMVPGLTAEQVLAVIDPVRRSRSVDDFERVVVAEHEDGVVLFTYWFVPERYVRALSRRGGLAASYANTVEGDDHVLVAREGKVVRSFDPFLAYDYVKTRPLPEEKGLDLEDDTWAASWTLLERITSIHVTEDWLFGQDHPAYRLKG